MVGKGIYFKSKFLHWGEGDVFVLTFLIYFAYISESHLRATAASEGTFITPAEQTFRVEWTLFFKNKAQLKINWSKQHIYYEICKDQMGHKVFPCQLYKRKQKKPGLHMFISFVKLALCLGRYEWVTNPCLLQSFSVFADFPLPHSVHDVYIYNPPFFFIKQCW